MIVVSHRRQMYLTLHEVLKEPYMSMVRVPNSRSNPLQAACISICRLIYTCMTEVSLTVM